MMVWWWCDNGDDDLDHDDGDSDSNDVDDGVIMVMIILIMMVMMVWGWCGDDGDDNILIGNLVYLVMKLLKVVVMKNLWGDISLYIKHMVTKLTSSSKGDKLRWICHYGYGKGDLVSSFKWLLCNFCVCKCYLRFRLYLG